MSSEKDVGWDLVIEPRKKRPGIHLAEIYRYRDLVVLFVKRDFVSIYKQTILGPVWIILQPLLTTITFAVVFGKIAHIATGAPPILFYLIGVTSWTYFADCVLKTSETFIGNQNLFGKVYFPRLIVPLSIVLTNLIKFAIQFGLFLAVYAYYLIAMPETGISPSPVLLLFPLVILIMAAFGMGVGLVISSLTTKYRDLRFLIQFGIQLAMFATPIVYPLNSVSPDIQWILQLNPMCPVIETIKAGFFGEAYGIFSWTYLLLAALSSVIMMLLGGILFSRIERTFMDSI